MILGGSTVIMPKHISLKSTIILNAQDGSSNHHSTRASKRDQGSSRLRVRSTRSCGRKNINLQRKITKKTGALSVGFQKCMYYFFRVRNSFHLTTDGWMKVSSRLNSTSFEQLGSCCAALADGQESARICMRCFSWWMEKSSVNSLS